MKNAVLITLSMACAACFALALSPQARAANDAGDTAAARGSRVARPIVLRPRIAIGDRTEVANGVAFLMRTKELGTVAVTTAHAFDLGLLAKTELVEFERLDTSEIVATSSRLATFPGLPFYALGGRLDRAFLVYLLDTSPNAEFSPDSKLEVEIGSTDAQGEPF